MRERTRNCLALTQMSDFYFLFKTADKHKAACAGSFKKLWLFSLKLFSLYCPAGSNDLPECVLPPCRVKKDLLPLVRSLCQDVEYEVRSCMCRQLENIARGIG